MRTPRSRSRAAELFGGFLWTLPLALLTAVWLWLAFSAGGYLEQQYTLPALAVSLFSLIVYLLVAYPRRPRQLSMALLLLLTGYALWVAASAAWAPSIDRVWEEAARTFTYLLVLTLALTFLTQAGARRAMRYLLLIGSLVLIGVSLWRLATTPAGAGLFFLQRFAFPTSYPNNTAATFLVLFWPLLWIASDPRERAPWRGTALAACWGLTALAILTQSRGGAWAMAATLIVAVIVHPARLRTLVFLLTPAVLTVWAFPTLNAYWQQGPAEVDVWSAPRAILVGMGVALLTGFALALLEPWIRVSRRMRLVFGSLLIAGVVAGGALGWVELSERVGDPLDWLRDSYARFTAEEETTIPGLDTAEGGMTEPLTRFATVGANGRWLIWQTAWRVFEEERWHGVGAGNFGIAHDRLREQANVKVRQPHSIELRLLSETGIVGAALFGAALSLGLGGTLWPRFAAGWRWVRRSSRPGQDGPWGADPRRWAWNASLSLGVLYWLVHGSVEWLWHMPAVTIPALLMLALGVATTDAAAETLWPRWQRLLARSHEVTPFLMPPMVVMMRRRMRIGPEFDAPQPPGATSQPPGAPSQPPPAPSTEGTRGADGEASFSMARRSHRHEDKWRRRTRREDRRERRASLLYPPGGISRWFRRIAVLVSAVALLGLTAPYVSARLQETTLRDATTAPDEAMRAASAAAWLQPADPGPLLARAAAYTKQAAAAADLQGTGSAEHRLRLALALDAQIQAIERDPAWWVVHYQAGRATDRLLAATSPSAPPPAPGVGGTSMTPADEVQALLVLPPDDLRLLARSYYLAAQARNPLNAQIARSLQALEESADTQRNGES